MCALTMTYEWQCQEGAVRDSRVHPGIGQIVCRPTSPPVETGAAACPCLTLRGGQPHLREASSPGTWFTREQGSGSGEEHPRGEFSVDVKGFHLPVLGFCRGHLTVYSGNHSAWWGS